MRAALYERFGGPEVVHIGEVERPMPSRGELLIRVRAAALNPKDVYVRKGLYRVISGRSFPKRIGYDWAGEVIAAGAGVRDFAPGDRLFGMIDGWRGRRGTLAEYVCVKASERARIPPSLTCEEAAGLGLGSLTALQGIRDRGRLRHGSRICINGASGGVGVFAIQIAKALGAHVTSVSSASNVDLCRGLGADEALDYARDDPFAEGSRYDVVFDVFGNRSFGQTRGSLGAMGIFVSTVPSRQLARAMLATLARRPAARMVIVRSSARDLETLVELLKEGRLRPVIDRVVPMSELPAAMAYLETKRARGKVVVRIDG